MKDKDYKIILPLTLEGVSKYGDMYDVTLLSSRSAKFLIISGEDFDTMCIDNICLELYRKFGFLLGEGDYCFIDYVGCESIKKYLENKNDIKKQLSLELYNAIINFCNEAIRIKTGLGFDF